MAGNSADDWQGYLDPDEVVLWQGRPQQGWSWRAGENGTIILGLFVLGFFWFFTLEQIWYGDPLPLGFALGGTAAAAGLALIGPLAMVMVRRGTWYTLTSRRAIIAHWPMIAGITVYRGVDCYAITEVDLVPSDLSGFWTVQFSHLSQRFTFDDGWQLVAGQGRSGYGEVGGHRRDHRVGFERIPDGPQVADLCRRVRDGKQTAAQDNPNRDSGT